MVGSLAKLEVFSESIRQVKEIVENLQEFLEMPELPEPKQNAALRGYEVKVQKVCFSYTGKKEDEVLHGIDLTMKQGTFTALVGPSGSGKSTVAKLISRFWDVSSGEISIGGVNIKDMPLSQLTDTVSFVAQDNFLFRCSLILVFLSFSIFSSLEPVSDSAHILSVIDNAMNQLETLQENNYIDQNGKEIILSKHDIVFSHVDFGYDKRNILKDVSFSIPEKTTTAIVGPSGSGKTTICNLLARFYDVNDGSIMVGGHDVKEFTCDSLLSNIAMVFQNVYLFHDTIRSNICFGKPDSTEEEMIAAAKKACCHDFIMALPDEYDTVIGEGGGTLSGGEKQRISIARAMLKDAPIIILDEATASIDPENEHLIQAAISELTRGKTIITIAHRLATIENADQILVLDEGRVVQTGTHQKMIEKEGIYRRFIEIRKQAEEWRLA